MGFFENMFPQRSINGMCLAAACGDLRVVEEFLDSGVDIDGIHEDGGTALMLAAYRGNIEIVKYLVDRGADIRKKDKGVTALDVVNHVYHQWHSNKISGGKYGKDGMLIRLDKVKKYLTEMM